VNPADVAEEHDRADTKHAAESGRKNAGQNHSPNIWRGRARFTQFPSINAFGGQILCSTASLVGSTEQFYAQLIPVVVM
jgi:hypothetical protein